MSEEFNSKLFTFNSKEWIKIIHSRDFHFFLHLTKLSITKLSLMKFSHNSHITYFEFYLT